MELSFIFSFRNEEESIPELVRRVGVVCQELRIESYELIFVNDFSTDNSEIVLTELQKSHPITIINMTRNFGTAPCVLAGLDHSAGDAVVYMDSDLQDPPEVVAQMIAEFRSGADVVHAKRRPRSGESRVKLAVTKIAYKIINLLSDIPIPENTGDFKLLSRAVVDDIMKMSEDDPFMRGLSVWVGYDQRIIGYDRHPRNYGTTKFPIFSRNPVREFIRGITSFSAGPLYFALVLGLIISLGAILLIAYAVLTKFLGVAVPGVSGIIIVIAIFNGAILVSNGIIGIYVAKIFFQVKQRPRYLIRNIKKPFSDKA